MYLERCTRIFRAGIIGLTVVTRTGERKGDLRLPSRSFGHILGESKRLSKASSSALLRRGFCIVTWKGKVLSVVGQRIDRRWWWRTPGYEVKVI